MLLSSDTPRKTVVVFPWSLSRLNVERLIGKAAALDPNKTKHCNTSETVSTKFRPT